MLPAGSLLAKNECERPQKRAQPLHSPALISCLPILPLDQPFPRLFHHHPTRSREQTLGSQHRGVQLRVSPPLQSVNTWLSNSRWELKQLPPPCPSQGCLERLTISWEIQLFPLMSLEIPVLRCSCSSGRGGPEPLLIIPGGF